MPTNSRRALTTSLLFAALAACAPPTDALAETRDRIERAALRVAAADTERSTVISATLATAVAGQEPCPIRIEDPSSGTPDLDIVAAAAVATAPGPARVAFVEGRNTLLTDMMLLDGPTRAEAEAAAARADALLEPPAWDASLVATDLSWPDYDEARGYTPGLVQGRLVVWDYEAERIACVADVAVTNSPDIIDRAREGGEARERFESDPAAYLREDLESRAFAAAVQGARAVATTE